MPVQVVAGSGGVVFPELVRVQGHEGESGLVPGPMDQFALGEPPAVRFPGVHVIEQTDLGFNLAGAHGCQELAGVKAVREVVELAALVAGLSALASVNGSVLMNGY